MPRLPPVITSALSMDQAFKLPGFPPDYILASYLDVLPGPIIRAHGLPEVRLCPGRRSRRMHSLRRRHRQVPARTPGVTRIGCRAPAVAAGDARRRGRDPDGECRAQRADCASRGAAACAALRLARREGI